MYFDKNCEGIATVTLQVSRKMKWYILADENLH